MTTTTTANCYIALYRGKKIKVYAETSYGAQLAAAAVFKAKKPYEVTVVLSLLHCTGGRLPAFF